MELQWTFQTTDVRSRPRDFVFLSLYCASSSVSSLYCFGVLISLLKCTVLSLTSILTCSFTVAPVLPFSSGIINQRTRWWVTSLRCLILCFTSGLITSRRKGASLSVSPTNAQISVILSVMLTLSFCSRPPHTNPKLFEIVPFIQRCTSLPSVLSPVPLELNLVSQYLH